MADVSRPMIVAFASVVLLGAVYFLMFRPKTVTSGEGRAPVPSQLASPGGSPPVPVPAPAPATPTGSGAAPVPTGLAGVPSSADAAAGPKVALDNRAPAGERKVLAAMRADKAVVLLFWDADGVVDRQANRVVSAVTKGRKKLFVARVTAKEVAGYEAITGGDIRVSQTPTTMVISPKGQTEMLTGLLDSLALTQAVNAAQG